MNKTSPSLSRAHASISRVLFNIRAFLLIACAASGLLRTALAVDGFNPRPNSGVLSLAYQADGKLVVGGHFTKMAGVAGTDSYDRVHLARLNTDGSIDTSFYPSTDGDVSTVAILPDGKILIGGSFKNVTPSASTQSFPLGCIALLNANGSLYTSFAPSFALSNGGVANVQAIVRQPDGKIIVGGAFDSVKGSTNGVTNTTSTVCANIVRLNADGSIDTTFDVKTDGAVKSIALQANGYIVIGGGFKKVKGTGKTDFTTVYYATRLQTDGTLDTFKVDNTDIPTFNPGADNVINSVVVQPDGKILIAGQFNSVLAGPNTTESAYDRLNIARYNADGTIDKTFYPGASSTITTMVLQRDGKIVIGGHFAQVFSAIKTGVVSTGYVGRINADGSADSTFHCDAGQYVTALAMQDDGKIVIGGWFTEVNGGAPSLLAPITYLARIHSDGTVDTDWTPGTSSSALTPSAIQPDGKMILSGNISSLGGVTFNGLARTFPDGTIDPSFNCSLTGAVNQITVLADGRILIVGNFNLVNGVTRVNAAILKSDGSLDTSFSAPSINSVVYSAAVQSDGKIVIGGFFNLIGTTTRNYLARLGTDGSLDTTFNPNPDNAVYVVKVLSDGRILIGGNFSNFTPNAGTSVEGRGCMAMIKSDGTLDTDFIPAFNAVVFDIQFQSDGKILVGGNFNLVGTKASSSYQVRNHMVRLDDKGLLDSTFTADVGGYVSFIKLQTDGKILIGGNFSTVNSVARNIFARLNSDGTLDTGYNPDVNGGLSSILLQPDGSVVITGKFTTVQPPNANLPIARPGLAKIKADGTLDSSFGVNPPTSQLGEVDVVTATSNGSLIVGGLFSNLAGSPGPNLSRFGPNGIVDESFNSSPNNRVLSLLEMSVRSRIAVFANRFAWLNPDLSAHNAFASLNIVDDGGRIYVALPLADGSALIGGRFTINGPTQTVKNLARIKADGTLDETFRPQPDGAINAIQEQADHKILVGGTFQSIGGFAQFYLARLNAIASDGTGTADTSFKLTLNSSVEAILVKSDGYIMIGGSFTAMTAADGTSSYTLSYVGRLKPDGALDTTYSPLPDAKVSALAIQSDGKIIIGGLFTSVQGVGSSTATARKHIARLNDDGSVDQNFDPSLSGEVLSIIVQPDDKIIAAGPFQTINPGEAAAAAAVAAATAAGTTVPSMPVAVSKPYLVRLNNEGTLDTSFAPPAPSAYINRLALDQAGNVLAVGQFLRIGDVSAPYVARFTPTGALDSTFRPDANAPVYALAIASDRSILMGGNMTILDNDSILLVGGAFTSIGNEPRKYLALLSRNGQPLISFQADPDAAVNALARHGDDGVLIAGAFKNVSGQSRSYIARLQTSGSLDNAFKPDVDGPISSMVVQTDGKILVAGSFANVAGASRKGIARLNSDGSIDSSFNPGVTGAVSSLYVDETGRILVGGSFTGIAGSSRSYLARLSAAGVFDGSFNATTDGPVYSLATVIGGQIFLGGSFTQVNGQSRSNFARLDSAGNLLADSSVGANQAVRSMAVLSDGKVALGGSFTKFNGDSHYLIARNSTGVLVRQSLFVNAARDTITWTRQTGSPLVTNVVFEYSPDGTAWSILGTPTISADSQTLTLTGLSLPVNTQFFLRVGAYISVGQNGSGSMYQNVWLEYLSTILLPSTADTEIAKGNAVSIGGVASRNGLLFSASNLPPGLSIDPLTGRIYGTPTALGNYLVRVHYADLFTSGDFTQAIKVTSGTGNQTNGNQNQRLLAYSTRATSSNANPLIIGFVVKGNAQMPVLLRAVGPTLTVLAPDIPNPMAAPTGTLYRMTAQGAVMLSTLQAWSDASGSLAATTARVGAQPLLAGSKDVSTVANLDPGAYTWVITSPAAGVVLAEVYDANAVGAVNPSRLADCSTRGFVNASDRIISGYILDGNSQSNALLQAVGPSLSAAVGDVLNDPRAILHLQDGTAVATNDNWGTQATTTSGWQVGTGSEVAAAISSMGASVLPSGSKDSSLLVNLPSGIYMLEVTSADTDSGNVLIEVYLP